MLSLQDGALPSSVNPSTITNGASACAAIGESFSSKQNICFTLGANGLPNFGWTHSIITYGQCAESLTGMHPGYFYETTPQGQYVLFCVAPGEYSQNATAWYDVESTWLGFTGSPISLGNLNAVPQGQLFDITHPTVQSVFTKIDAAFCAANQSGVLIGLCLSHGGAISVGFQ